MGFFAKRWQYKEIAIEINYRRAIYDFIKDDNYKDEKYRRKHGKKERTPKQDLLEGYDCEVKPDYLVCIYLSNGDLFKADEIWAGMDIVELYEKQAYKLVYEYTEFDISDE